MRQTPWLATTTFVGSVALLLAVHTGGGASSEPDREATRMHDPAGPVLILTPPRGQPGDRIQYHAMNLPTCGGPWAVEFGDRVLGETRQVGSVADFRAAVPNRGSRGFQVAGLRCPPTPSMVVQTTFEVLPVTRSSEPTTTWMLPPPPELPTRTKSPTPTTTTTSTLTAPADAER
ncbi:hypothetical protein ACFVKB_41945 [Rhodococcus sp. NPDC127530]|uniref:hypothetical protein n=1 Tax=unclassified Rhodococcus (in: high G+C Gram-positive bacteria) TaxID=192944 RepID=UPI00363AF065